MPAFSCVVLGVTVLLGVTLLLLQSAGRRVARLWMPGALHGLLGAIGFGALIVVLQGPPRGEAMGAGSFGRVAAILLATALLAGLHLLLARLRRQRPPVLVIGIHAMLAITGFVLLAAYVSMPA